MKKKRTKGGGQHAISAKIDNDKWEWLKNMPNKNRIINQGLCWWQIQNLRFSEWNDGSALDYWIRMMNEGRT